MRFETNKIDSLKKEIKELNNRLEKVYNAGYEGIEYVGAANYAERESEARIKLNRAMYGDDYY
jgi:hypothetical protein